MKKCGNCEKMILERAICCPYCGMKQETRVAESAAESIGPENAEEPEAPGELEEEAMKTPGEPEKTVKPDADSESERNAKGKEEENARRWTASNYCPNCGRKLRKEERYCSGCGKKVGTAESEAEWENERDGDGEKEIKKETEGDVKKDEYQDIGKNVREIYVSVREKISREPESIRTIFCIIAGIFYLCGVLKYLSGYGYYEDSALRLCTMAACGWNVFILYKIGFRCSRQNGANLMYGLMAGCGIESLLFIIRGNQTYDYVISVTEYLEFLRPYAVVGLGCYLLKKEGYLRDFLPGRKKKETKESGYAVSPGTNEKCGGQAVLGTNTGNEEQAVSGMNASHQEQASSSVNTGSGERTFSDAGAVGQKENAVSENASAPWNADQGRLLRLMGGKLFLVLCAVYTGELVYQIVSNFSLFNVLGKLLSIFLCVFLCQICMYGRKNVLKAETFKRVSLIIEIQYAIKNIAGFLVCIFALFSGPIGFIVTLVMTIVDICYMGSLRKTAASVQKIAEGAKESIKVSLYPMLVLGVNILTKIISFFKAFALMSAMNYTSGLLNSYGSAAGSGIASFLEEFDIGTGISSGIISFIINMLLMPFQNWIQAIFGGYTNPLILLLGLVVLVCEFLMIRQLQVCGKEMEKQR